MTDENVASEPFKINAQVVYNETAIKLAGDVIQDIEDTWRDGHPQPAAIYEDSHKYEYHLPCRVSSRSMAFLLIKAALEKRGFSQVTERENVLCATRTYSIICYVLSCEIPE